MVAGLGTYCNLWVAFLPQSGGYSVRDVSTPGEPTGPTLRKDQCSARMPRRLERPTVAAMTSETEARAPEAPPTQSSRFARTPLWARIAAPVVVLIGGAAVVTGVMAAGSQPAATVESACRSAIEAKLESRGHTDIDVARSLRVTEADGGQRVSGSAISVDEAGHVDYHNLRCVVRVENEAIRVVSARVSDS
jgi:hypothetical protein